MIFKPYSKVFIHAENSGWVLTREAEEIKKILNKIKIKQTKIPLKQICYLPDKYYAINQSKFHLLGNKQVFDYFHGIPSISSQFHDLFNLLKSKIDNFEKIRVSNTLVKNFFIDEGLENKINMIPIGIDTKLFHLMSKEKSNEFRIQNGIPLNSVIIGSFQKDGNGWENGNDPKLIKGPDIFIETLKSLKCSVKEIFVILTGPSRGFVKKGLEKLNIPYKHFYINDYQEIYKYYSMLDLYLITSREEGGPKALLESMACGIPLVSTPVGQSIDMIKNDINGFMSTSWCPEELSDLAFRAISKKEDFSKNSRQTAEDNDYSKQLDLWKNFFDFCN
jgi:glycosyltransferase involved in cell wall biosynthesis